MQIKQTPKSDTELTLSVVATPDELKKLKEHILTHFQDQVKVPGFRAGKVPPALLEKHVSPAALQQEFLEEAINQFYGQAIRAQQIRPVAQPQVSLKKFVPYTTLEFDAELEILGPITLSDYTKIKKVKKPVKITKEDVDEVLKSLQKRAAESKEVERPAAEDDELVIDFSGKDTNGEPVNGAASTDYPLLLGSKSFIPGFEEQLIGLKTGDEKNFTLTFPKDYRPAVLTGKKVTFRVEVKKVNELALPKLDDTFAAKIGPFKTLADLKEDIKKQLTAERQQAADRQFEGELVQEITAKSKVSVPKSLIDEQIKAMLRELKQNLTYRGQTYEEYLTTEDKTDEQYRKAVLAPQAEERVKAGLVLSEIAEKEKLDVRPEELEIRLKVLKGQYQDQQMQAELDKPENQRDIVNRILTEKTLQRLVSYSLK